MKKYALICLILICALFTGCADSIVIQIAMGDAETEATTAATTAKTSSPSELFDELSKSKRIVSTNYPVGQNAFYIDETKCQKDKIQNFQIIDYFPQNNEFLYYYSASSKEKNMTYYCFAQYNYVTRKYIVNKDGKASDDDDLPLFKCVASSKNDGTYFVLCENSIYKFNYSMGNVGNLVTFSESDGKAILDSMKGEVASQTGISYPYSKYTDLFLYSDSGILLVSAMLYKYDYSGGASYIDENENQTSSSDAVFVVIAINYDTMEHMFIQIAYKYSTLKMCTFSSSGLAVYGNGYNKFTVRSGENQSELAIGSASVQDINGIQSNGNNLFVEFGDDYTSFYKLTNTSQPDIFDYKSSFYGAIPENLYSSITVKQLLVLDEKNVYGACSEGLYNRNKLLKSGCYYAVFAKSVSAENLVLLGFDDTDKITRTVTLIGSNGKKISETTETITPSVLDAAYAKVYLVDRKTLNNP